MGNSSCVPFALHLGFICNGKKDVRKVKNMHSVIRAKELNILY